MGSKYVDLLICQKLAKKIRTCMAVIPVELQKSPCKSKNFYMYGSKTRWSVDLQKLAKNFRTCIVPKPCWIAEISLQEPKIWYFSNLTGFGTIHVWKILASFWQMNRTTRFAPYILRTIKKQLINAFCLMFSNAMTLLLINRSTFFEPEPSQVFLRSTLCTVCKSWGADLCPWHLTPHFYHLHSLLL